MGNMKPINCANPGSELGKLGALRRSRPTHRVPHSIATGTSGTTGTTTNSAKLGAFEIIDLCSESESDGDAPPPPPKKVKLGTPMHIPIPIPMPAVDGQEGMDRAGAGAKAGPGMGDEVFRGVKWKTGNLEDGGKGGEDVKDETPRHNPISAPAQPSHQSTNPIFASAEVLQQIQARIAAPRCRALTPTQTPQQLTDISAASNGAVTQIQTPIGDSSHEGDKNDSNHASTFKASSSALPTADEFLHIEIKNPSPFTTAHIGRSKSIKPVIPRTETIGTKKRKMVGPFYLEDDDDEEANDESFCSPLEDEGYGSFFSNGQGKCHGKIEGKTSGSCFASGSGPSSSDLNSADQLSGKVRVGEMDLFQRRRKSEDKCAETSRRMREEALAKRNTDARGSQQVGPSGGFLKGDSSGGRTNWTSSNPGKQTKVKTNSEHGRLCAANGLQRRHDWLDDDNGDLFDDGALSQENIEAQLDLAQAFANSNGNLPSQKDLTRSHQPSSSASSMEKADPVLTLDSPSNGNDRGVPLLHSIPHPEKQLLKGELGGIVTSGIERYDREQAEKYWRSVNREERRRRKEMWPEKMEIERMVPSSAGHCAPTKVVDGALGKDEARLLAAKEPLRPAPNVNGVLAQLAKKNRTFATPSHPRDLPSWSEDSHRQSSPACRQGREDRAIDENIWTKNGRLKERKRDVESLMSAFTETAKCWCAAFDSMSSYNQKRMKSEVQELRAFADPIVRGYSFRDKAEKRITHIKSNMVRRAKNYEKANGAGSHPSQHEVDLTLVELMGHGRFQRGKKRLNDVFVEYERYKQENRSRHSQRERSRCNGIESGRVKPTKVSSIPYKELEEFCSASDDSNVYDGFKLSRNQQVAWQGEDARRERIEQILALYEEPTEPVQQDERTRKVRFAGGDPWEKRFDAAQNSEFEESDEDEDETAPSFGRGENDSATIVPRMIPMVENAQPARNKVGGKGLLSELRDLNEEMVGAPPISAHRPQARKGLPSQIATLQPDDDGQTPGRPTGTDVGRKTVSVVEQQEPQEKPQTRIEDSNIGETQHDAEGLQSDPESSFSDEEDASDVQDDMHVLQYDIFADYENFDDFEDAELVPLGRYIDVKAALSQMNRVTTDTVASASRKYRHLRVIWDTDDFELAAQTVILPTGGEFRVRMVKSWAPATNWPGKRRTRAVSAPKVVYIVHETKKTSLRAPADTGGDTEEDELFGREDFEDPEAVVEKERDMSFSSRQCANEIAKNRLIAFSSRYDPAEDAGDTAGTKKLADYMEQIQHDKVCFDQERRFWIQTTEMRKGKEEVKIWVEEMFVDMPHI